MAASQNSGSTSAVDTSQIVKNIAEQHAAWQDGDKRAREAIISSCFKLISEVEAPGETIVRLTWAQLCQLAALRTAVDLDVFKHVVSKDDSAKDVSQLAEATSCSPVLMGRLMNTIGSIGFAREVGEDSYVPSTLTKAMTQSAYQDSVKFMFDICFPANLKTPEFLRDIKYQNPLHPLDTPFQFLHNCRGEKHAFQMMQEMGAMQGFDSMMKVWMGERPHWSDEKAGFYPFTSRLVEGARKSDDNVFLVDVGAGQGNDLLRMLRIHPQESLPGRLVLQDLPQVIDIIPSNFLPASIEMQGYDFNTPQPVKGARTYFMHSIIHDYPDDAAKTILKQVAGAMDKGYSKLILWDQVVPNKGVDAIVAAQDWQMMTFLSGCERTEAQWRSSIENPETGLKVTGIWYYTQYDQAVIEAELA